MKRTNKLLITGIFLIMALFLSGCNNTKAKSEMDLSVEKFTTEFIKETYNVDKPYDYKEISKKYLKEDNDVFNKEMETRNIAIQVKNKLAEKDGKKINTRITGVSANKSLLKKDSEERSIYKVDLIVDLNDKQSNEQKHNVSAYVMADGDKYFVLDMFSDDAVSQGLYKNDRLEKEGMIPYLGEVPESERAGYKRKISGMDIDTPEEKESKIKAIEEFEKQLLESI